MSLYYICAPAPTISKQDESLANDFVERCQQWEKEKNTHEKLQRENALGSKISAVNAEISSLIRELENVRHGQAEPAQNRLMARSGMKFGTQEEVDRHNAQSSEIQNELKAQLNVARKLCTDIQQKTESARALLDNPQGSTTKEKTDELVQRADELIVELANIRERLQPWLGTGDNPSELAKVLRDCEEMLSAGIGGLNSLESVNSVEIEPIRQKLDEADTRSNELLNQFPMGNEYIAAILDPSLAPLRELRFGEGDLSIAAEGDLGRTLVLPLVSKWLEKSHYTFTEAEADNGVRLTVADNTQDAPRKVDIIKISHADAVKESKQPLKGAHIVFYSGLMKLENMEEKLCADALVFIPAEGQTRDFELDRVLEEQKCVLPAETPDGIAADLFSLRDSKAETITEEEEEERLKHPLKKLIIGAYHHLINYRTEEQMAHICYPGNRAYAPNVTNIATGQYWYVYDINFHKNSAISGWEQEKLCCFFLGDDAKEVIRDCHYVPMGTKEIPEIVSLTSKELPVDVVMRRIHALKFTERMRYGSTVSQETVLRGCQLPYPIFFPTGKANDATIDSFRTKNVIDGEMSKHIAALAKNYTWLVVVISGHADIRPFGNGMTNEQLSQERADNFLNNIVRPAAGDRLKPDSNGVLDLSPDEIGGEVPGKIFITDESNILVTTIGCGDDYAVATAPPEHLKLSQEEKDARYRRDRRASIHIIVPGIDADAVRERPGQDSASE